MPERISRVCRKLHLLFPLTCRYGGHYRAACVVASVLETRDPVECAVAHVVGRVSLHALEVIADGLTLWHDAQLAIDTTLVSP